MTRPHDEACPATPTSLAPGASITCTASYTITQTDLDAGSVKNTAQGHGYYGTTPVHSNYDDETVTTSYDFGDAPDPTYPTLLASNGARHVIVPGGISLGLSEDAESNGQPTIGANGDDTHGIDDEDGVGIPALHIGAPATLSLSNQGTGYLNAWIDFNADGDWGDLGEQIASDVLLMGSASPWPINIPTTAVLGTTYARFRFSTQQGLAPTGLALDGEVEDYKVVILEKQTGVTLAGFTAAAEGQTVNLAWETTSEAEIIGFNVLRMAEGSAFEPANAEFIPATYAGQGAGAAYTLEDDGLPAGAYTYRLEVIGLDGRPVLYADAGRYRGRLTIDSTWWTRGRLVTRGAPQ